MASDRAWLPVLTEHASVIADFVAELHRVPTERWTTSAARGKWSPAEQALHVVLAYEAGLAALAGGPSMQLRVSRARASLYRWLLLPLFLRRGSFPRGAEAPQELRPSPAEAAALSAPTLAVRLRDAASETAAALRAADRRHSAVRIVHAYFGPLRPLTALRLLSAHTRHHARQLSGSGARPAARTT